MTDDFPGASVEVVVLRAVAGLVVPVAGTIPFDLGGSDEPTGDLLSELLGSTVRIAEDEDPYEVLLELPVPSTFGASPWLAHSRAVVVHDDGTGRIGELLVQYSDEEGLRV